ncbi:hypothetical protein [Roseovarius sp. D0-M9]|uniref:hypothetical protein n=1 Tax=Roseovarius sp. D0-M9 TaxID=3127117 RepID=UPI0030105064
MRSAGAGMVARTCGRLGAWPALLALGLSLGAVPVTAFADTAPSASGQSATEPSDQTTGLMWNRTGLPAVFPLQVKTSAGQDYYLTLSDAETGEDALGAYIKGGDFFRVLVPPGSYTVRFHIGLGWQGEEDLFGPGAQTRLLDLDAPLTFETRSLGTKAGHLIDLERLGQREVRRPRIEDQLICQFQHADAPPVTYSFLKTDRARPNGRRKPIVPPKGPLRYEDRDLFGTALDPTYPGDRQSPQGYRRWSEYCG